MKRVYLTTHNLALIPQITSGLNSLGYCVEPATVKTKFERYDTVISYTLWQKGSRRKIINRATEAGATVFCLDMGWLRHPSIPYWQLAKRDDNSVAINGWGSFPVGDSSRWNNSDFNIKPWRTTGDHILLCANKGDDYKHNPDINHTSEWADEIITLIRQHTDRPIHFRAHPKGKVKCFPLHNTPDVIIDPTETLDQSLENAWCTVVYGSSVASHSILSGVPVIYQSPRIMCRELASNDISTIENPIMPDRQPVLERLIWSQWTEEEIANGTAWKHYGF